MITLLIGVVALVVAALDRRPRGLFVFIALAGLVFTVSPLNIIDIPIVNQEYRLRSALERNGLIRDGKLALNPDVKIPQEDAEIIVGSLTYLSPRVGWGHDSGSWFDGGARMEPHIWHRPVFAEEVLNGAADVCRARGNAKGDLFAAFGINPRTCRNASGRGLYRPFVQIDFSISGDWPIAAASRLRMVNGRTLSCTLKGDRWFLSVPARADIGLADSVDVTDSIVRLFKSCDWDGVCAESLNLTLKSADAYIDLRPGWTLVLSELWASGQDGEKVSELSIGPRVALVIRETPQP